MEFDVLGPLRLRGPAGVVEPAGQLQCVLLGVLLTRANEPVSVDVLTDALWHGQPEPRAPQRLQVHVHKLRRMLDDPARLSFGPGGYRLEVRPGELDVARFADLVDRGAASGDPARRAELVREALTLWRGTPFSGLDVPLLTDEARRLTERRLQALELRYEAEVAAGRHNAVVTALTRLVRDYPLREKLAGLLMTALYRDGRQAEALAVYRATRTTLADELGLDPGQELQALEKRILTGVADTVDATAEALVPAQLPPNVAGFVGRAAELSELDNPAGAEAAPVVVVTGTAGVGKTALAIRWSHHARDRFPDGQLHVDLHGYGPAEPVAPEDALAGFLRALGVDGPAIPADVAERSARFRTLVDGRRMILVLDNARTVDQVRPLLPGSDSVAVVVTSRDSLAGLVARDGALRIPLDRLPRSESVDLLTRLAGERSGPLVELIELVELCARLPLALRVAGELIRSRRGQGVAELVAELVDEQRRLDLLDTDGDPHTAVRAVFSWSYQNLAEPDARVFRLCGTHPGRDLDAYAVAAMTGDDLRGARRSLAALARAHLLDEPAIGRYQPHDLLRAYAAELAAAVDGPATSAAATARLRDFYLHTAAIAGREVAPRDTIEPRVDHPPSEVPAVVDHHAALRWLDTELGNLIAAVTETAPDYALNLSAALWRYLYIRGDVDDAVALHARAMAAARRTGDRLAEANTLRYLGSIYFRAGRRAASIEHSELALTLYRELGERVWEAAALNNLAAAYNEHHRYDLVIPLCERAAELLRAPGEETRLVSVLANLGDAHRTLGNHAEARRCYEEALTLADPVGPLALVYAWHGLAWLHSDTGHPREALPLALRALATARDAGDRNIESEVICNLGKIHARLGDRAEASRCLHESVALARAANDQQVTAVGLIALGDLHRDAGESAAAREWYREALTLVNDDVRPIDAAAAYEGLGDVCAALGDLGAARGHWERALGTFAGFGVPQVERVRAKLAAQPLTREPPPP